LPPSILTAIPLVSLSVAFSALVIIGISRAFATIAAGESWPSSSVIIPEQFLIR